MPAKVTIFAANDLVFVAAALAALAVAVRLWPRSRLTILRWLITAAVLVVASYALSRLGSALYNDPRPFTTSHVPPLTPHAPDNGFPSDHALLAAVLVIFVALVDPWWALPFIVLAVLVDWGRVGSGLHHVIDVVGSSACVALATAVAVIIAALVMRWLTPHLPAGLRERSERLDEHNCAERFDGWFLSVGRRATPLPRLIAQDKMEMTHERFGLQLGHFSAAGTRQGPKHPENEDSFCLTEPEDGATRAQYGDLYLVADGVGGYNAGEVASAMAVETIRDAYYRGSSAHATDNLIAAIEEANRRVHASAPIGPDDDHGMATTIVVAAVLHAQIVVANVGDSRAYICTGRRLQQLSRDHSWVQEAVERGILTSEEARQSSRRNVITRALGLAEQIDVESKTAAVRQQHTRVVLCTDGVHGVLDDEELATFLVEADRQRAIERILAEVDARKGHDDATIVIIDTGGRYGAVGEHRPRASFLRKLLQIARRG